MPPGGAGGGPSGVAVRNAERSSIEIKDLLRKLHPGGNHKDRIRRLNKFRSYVQPLVRVAPVTNCVVVAAFWCC
jgi:hypothetical protein